MGAGPDSTEIYPPGRQGKSHLPGHTPWVLNVLVR